MFTTRSQKDSKPSHGVDVSASRLHYSLPTKTGQNPSRTAWWYLWPGIILRFLRFQSDSINNRSLPNPVSSSDSFLFSRTSLNPGMSSVQNAQGNAGSSPWRRRIGPVGSASSLQQSPKSLGQLSNSVINVVLSQQQQHHQHHHHHSGPRRGHSWIRLSERKWACLLLCLFAIATLLVAFSLQHILTAQPNSSTVTVEEIRSSTDRLRIPHSN